MGWLWRKLINAYVIDPTMDVFASASNSGVSSDVKQVDNITVSGSVAEGDVFTLNIGGIIDLELVSSTLTYTATEADEKSGVSAIASALKSLVDADANASGFVDTSTSSGVLTIDC